MQNFVVVYVDDFIIGHDDPDICQQIVNALINILAFYGISINYEKSILTPVTTMDVLGFTVSKGKIVLPLKRCEKLINNLKTAITAERLSKRTRQRILGLIEATQLAISHIDLTAERR